MSISPDLIVTIGDSSPVQEDVHEALRVLRLVKPGIAMIHTVPGPEDLPTIGQIRASIPGIRLWIQTPANRLASGTTEQACALASRWVKFAVDLGAEVLSFNGEGASALGRSGWKPGQPLNSTDVAKRAKDVLAAAASQANGKIQLAWSSHDHPLSHNLPWGSIFGAQSPVVASLPQVYIDPENGSRGSLASAKARFAAVKTQHDALVHRGTIREAFAPAGEGFICYAQSHHAETAATCWLLDQSALAATWTVRRDGALCDDAGLLALRADAEMRRRMGHAPGKIVRFQASNGLTPDGIVGPATLRALGLL